MIMTLADFIFEGFTGHLLTQAELHRYEYPFNKLVNEITNEDLAALANIKGLGIKSLRYLFEWLPHNKQLQREKLEAKARHLQRDIDLTQHELWAMQRRLKYYKTQLKRTNTLKENLSK